MTQERYHKHGPSSDPYDVERRQMIDDYRRAARAADDPDLARVLADEADAHSAHDPDYCDARRLPGHVCNQPHASADPFGAGIPVHAEPGSLAGRLLGLAAAFTPSAPPRTDDHCRPFPCRDYHETHAHTSGDDPCACPCHDTDSEHEARHVAEGDAIADRYYDAHGG